MIVFLFLIIALCLYKIKIANNGYFSDFLEREQTNSIKGLFILFVFLRHSLQYVVRNGYRFNSFGDSIVLFTNGMLGQLIVVMFLFYSGYGVMEAIKNKGGVYIEKMPRNIPLMERKESTYYYPNSSSYYNKYFKDRDDYYKNWY